MTATGNLCALVYLSSCSSPMSEEELEALLRQAKSHNASANVSGILIYNDGNFIQYLEGPEPAVTNLFERIKLDPRHKNVTRLDFANIKSRVFGDWWMGFRKLSDEDAGRIKGEHDKKTIMMDALKIEDENHMAVIFKHCLQHMIRD